MADFGAVVDAFAPDPVPAGPELIRYAGGRRALTEQLSGMSGPPKRDTFTSNADYQAARTRWRSASRRVQRLDDVGAEGKQRRGAVRGPQLTPAQRHRVEEEQLTRKLAGLYRHGGRMRVAAQVLIESPGGKADSRGRIMPSGGPGVYITVEELAGIDLRDREAAGWALLDVFWDAYGLPAGEYEGVTWIRLWPDGTREPRD